jgi:hypothetical protein
LLRDWDRDRLRLVTTGSFSLPFFSVSPVSDTEVAHSSIFSLSFFPFPFPPFLLSVRVRWLLCCEGDTQGYGISCKHMPALKVKRYAEVEFTPEISHERDRSDRERERDCTAIEGEDARRGNKFRISFSYGFDFRDHHPGARRPFHSRDDSFLPSGDVWDRSKFQQRRERGMYLPMY